MDDGVAELRQHLLLPGRLVGEALAQDDHFLSLEESCASGVGSADYDGSCPQFTADITGKGLPFGSEPFTRQGVLPDIQRFWRSFDSRIVLWKYADPGMQEMTEYTGVGSLGVCQLYPVVTCPDLPSEG